MDSGGTLYLADTANNRIRKITSGGVVSTLAGSGSQTYADGTGASASFSQPYNVIVDASGNVYVGDTLNNRIRKITSAGVVTTFAGSGAGAYADGTGTSASFQNPMGVALDGNGNLYVADFNNHRIRKIDTGAVVSTLAGSGTAAFADGTGTGASFNNETGVVVDGSGNVYVADAANNRVRKVTSAGVVTTLAGSGTAAYADGTGTSANLNNPNSLVLDSSGSLYVADQHNHRIRKITSAGVVTTLAGSGTAGYADGTGTSAMFNNCYGLTMDASGNLYVSDTANHRIRKMTPLTLTNITITTNI